MRIGKIAALVTFLSQIWVQLLSIAPGQIIIARFASSLTMSTACCYVISATMAIITNVLVSKPYQQVTGSALLAPHWGGTSVTTLASQPLCYHSGPVASFSVQSSFSKRRCYHFCFAAWCYHLAFSVFCVPSVVTCGLDRCSASQTLEVDPRLRTHYPVSCLGRGPTSHFQFTHQYRV